MFAKLVIDGYIVALSTGGGTAITESEYSTIMQKIQNKPADPEGYQYRLRANNMEWELVELPEPEPVEEEAGPEDYEQALQEMGVDFSD